MGKVLLTGGNGFIAAHVLNVLLERGHTVVTTVRSAVKGDQILASYSSIPAGKLSYVVVDNIIKEGAFQDAVQSEPPFDFVIHAASPFPLSFEDSVKDVLDPAIKGTAGILASIKAHAPHVKRVVVTSSVAAMLDDANPPAVYDESSWNPVTWDEAVNDRGKTYRGSKTFAEKAAWDFVAKEKPNFDLVTLCPPLVYGPIAHHLSSLENINTSNKRILDIMQGKFVDYKKIPPAGTWVWTDVRDLALAHVKAIEVPEAGGQRFFVTGGHWSNKAFVDIMRETHPELEPKLPKDLEEDLPDDVYGYDNSKARTILGIEFRSLKESIVDTTTSLLKLGA
ncbi:hypothetical protein BX600DRAFT_468383 [Xylariales sp. PMI_506]|nr:hypothetical protein BX600DRAFT_468383 [Xylariales sp. PMI_506]